MTVPAAAPDATPAQRRSVVGAVLALVRWPNAVIASLGVLLGAAWVRPSSYSARDLLLGIVATWLVTAAANAGNDATDGEIDRIAHPDRPVPRGELSPWTAMRVALGAWFLGVAVGHALPAVPAMIVYAALTAASAYVFVLNRALFLGNVIVAIVASLPFLLGGALVGNARGVLPLFAVAVPLHLARELMKDLVDAPGDRGHRDTVPLRWGADLTRGLALAAVVAYALLATFLFAPAGLRRVALVPSVALGLWATVRAGERRAPFLLKLSMLLAMAALPLLR